MFSFYDVFIWYGLGIDARVFVCHAWMYSVLKPIAVFGVAIGTSPMIYKRGKNNELFSRAIALVAQLID